MPAQTITISQDLFDAAAAAGSDSGMTADQQIEHWAKIGKMAADNPHLTHAFMSATLAAQADIECAGGVGALQPYSFG